MLVVSGVYYPVDGPAASGCSGSRRSRRRRTRCAASAPRSSTGTGCAVGRRLAAARDRRRVGAARAVRVPHRRAVREAARKAEAVRMIRVAKTADDFALLRGDQQRRESRQSGHRRQLATAPGAVPRSRRTATRTSTGRASRAARSRWCACGRRRAAAASAARCSPRRREAREGLAARRCGAAFAKATRSRLRFVGSPRLRGGEPRRRRAARGRTGGRRGGCRNRRAARRAPARHVRGRGRVHPGDGAARSTPRCGRSTSGSNGGAATARWRSSRSTATRSSATRGSTRYPRCRTGSRTASRPCATAIAAAASRPR